MSNDASCYVIDIVIMKNIYLFGSYNYMVTAYTVLYYFLKCNSYMLTHLLTQFWVIS